MEIVRPTVIESPITGQPVRPVISERVVGDKIYTEASWYEPGSRQFIRRGVVKIVDVATGKDVTQDVTHNRY